MRPRMQRVELSVCGLPTMLAKVRLYRREMSILRESGVFFWLTDTPNQCQNIERGILLKTYHWYSCRSRMVLYSAYHEIRCSVQKGISALACPNRGHRGLRREAII